MATQEDILGAARAAVPKGSHVSVTWEGIWLVVRVSVPWWRLWIPFARGRIVARVREAINPIRPVDVGFFVDVRSK